MALAANSSLPLAPKKMELKYTDICEYFFPSHHLELLGQSGMTLIIKHKHTHTNTHALIYLSNILGGLFLKS